MTKSIFSFLYILVILYSSKLLAQNNMGSIKATRITTQIKIDGTLEEKEWKTQNFASDFTEKEPYNGRKCKNSTFVRILYDNAALYVGFEMHDTSPDSIATQLVQRDDFGQADHCGFVIDPYGDAISGMAFYVSAAGVQLDAKQNMNDDDFSWDAVWDVAVKKTNYGWNAEFKIPYSALRFPKTEMQNWTINFFRNIQRYKIISSWQHIQPSSPNILQDNGKITNIKNIIPPFRLSLRPYASAYLVHDGETKSLSKSLRGGLDLKYGINQSLTLDMMLIPDFGQVQSDDQVLNLSAFETYYSEKRSFFTEGTELYNAAEIFYSRRIGGTPQKYYDVEEQLQENEKITANPSEIQLLNATKITGKTNTGLSVGVLNAYAAKSFATITDTIKNTQREFQTQKNTNYNVAVFKKSFQNNSYISVINTNLYQLDTNFTANVTGLESRFTLLSNNYDLRIKGAYSHRDIENDTEGGYYSEFSFSKIKGNFLLDLTSRIESETYEPNDMGFLHQNNEFSNSLELQYNIYKPIWRLLNLYNEIEFEHSQLFKPRKFRQAEIKLSSRGTFKNHITAGIFIKIKPTEGNDFDEPRVENKFYITPAWTVYNTYISSDYRKPIAFDASIGAYKATENERFGVWTSLSPLWRINNKWLMRYRFYIEEQNKDYGFVEQQETDQQIIFGQRNVIQYTNTLSLDYILSNKSAITFRARHYWSTVEYNNFYFLQSDGTLLQNNTYITNNNINFNSFNIDLVYNWEFAPGSFFSLVWKNSILNNNDNVQINFAENISDLFKTSALNSLSVKFIYYLDVAKLSKTHNKKI